MNIKAVWFQTKTFEQIFYICVFFYFKCCKKIVGYDPKYLNKISVQKSWFEFETKSFDIDSVKYFKYNSG